MTQNTPIPMGNPLAALESPKAVAPTMKVATPPAPRRAAPARKPARGEDVLNPLTTISLAEKAAIIIAALGAEAAPHVLQGMSEITIRRFAQAMSKIGVVTPEMLEHVVDEFNAELGARNQVKLGATEAKRILSELLDEDSVARIMDEVGLNSGRTTWEKLSNSGDQAIAGYLRHEHPQTVAVVLSMLRPEKAARVLERLDSEFAQIVVLRLARVPRLDSEVMEILKDVVYRDFLAVMAREQATRKPADVIGSMMNSVSVSQRARLLEQLEQEKPKLAKQVQKIMFGFADIAERVDPRDAGAVLKAVDEATLVLALKHAQTNAPKVVSFFLNNISKRLGQRLEGELSGGAAVVPREGEQAQTALVNAVRDLSRDGEIRMLDDDPEEE
jgi:flagellar motor switch protein FliG